LRLLAQLTPATFWLISGGESQEPPLMTERFLFCFEGFLFSVLFHFRSIILFDSFELDDQLEL